MSFPRCLCAVVSHFWLFSGPLIEIDIEVRIVDMGFFKMWLLLSFGVNTFVFFLLWFITLGIFLFFLFGFDG